MLRRKYNRSPSAVSTRSPFQNIDCCLVLADSERWRWSIRRACLWGNCSRVLRICVFQLQDVLPPQFLCPGWFIHELA